MKPEEIVQLSKNIFRANKAKGFWDNERNVGDLLALVNSELYEALEADRGRKRANVEAYLFDLDNADSISLELGLSILNKEDRIKFTAHTFKRYIKDTKEDELADFLIRIMDFFGSGQWYEPEAISRPLNYHQKHFEKKQGLAFGLLKKYEGNFPSFVYNVTRSMPLQENVERSGANALYDICSLFVCVVEYCKAQKINYLFHIEEKLKYNATRPIRHGKEY